MQKNEIIRIYGTNYKEMTIQLLKEADLIKLIPAGAKTIGIKPNLVTPTPASYGATTHPEIVAGIIEYLQENGDFRIMIAEGSWVGDKTSEAFAYCGYQALADNYGAELCDTQKDASFTTRSGDLKLHVCSCVKEFDFLINVPVLKGHCQTKVTCALKNMKGLIPNSEKRRFHTLGLHRPIAALNTCIQQDFIVVDHICGDPDFEEGGNPVTTDCIFVSRDPVLTDAYTAYLLGVKPEKVAYIKNAEKDGVGTADLSRLQLYTLKEGRCLREKTLEEIPVSDYAGTSKKVLEVSYAVEEIDSCSACYGTLIPALSRLKEEGLISEDGGYEMEM